MNKPVLGNVSTGDNASKLDLLYIKVDILECQIKQLTERLDNEK